MIFTIFKKELKDTLRDRRTLIMMLVIPILIFPVIMNIFVSVSAAFNEAAATKEIKIGFIGDKEGYLYHQLDMLPEAYGTKEILLFKDSTEMKTAIRTDSIQLGFISSKDLDEEMAKHQPSKVKLLFNATEIGMMERGERYLEVIQSIAQQERYIDMNLKESELTPFELTNENVASDQEMIGKLAGGLLPYIFIAFGFIGCMYPAIDLFTGEKERGTIETLLTTPVSRLQILFGKMGVVVLSGLLAASAALVGLFLSIEFLDVVENEEILGIVHGMLNTKFILLMFFLLIPLTIFFAGVMIPIAVYAKSFKEAQSIITPLNIIMVLPAMIGFFPGISLNWITACIPVINVVLATKDLMAGTLDTGLLILSFMVMLCLAILSVFVSYKQFDKETNIIL